MIASSSPLFKVLDFVADAINPILALLLLGLLFIATRNREVDWKFWIAAVVGVALVYVLRTIDRRADLWESFGGDYSTHTALAVALLVPLLFLRRRLWPVWVGVLVVYAALMVPLGFHTVLDIATTLLVIVPLIALIYFPLLRSQKAKPVRVESP